VEGLARGLGAVVAAVFVAAVVVEVPSPLAAGESLRATTLVSTTGRIRAVAQDADWLAWTDTEARCDRQVQVHNLRTRATTALLTRGSPLCHHAEGINWFSSDELALARSRALWTYRYFAGNTYCGAEVFTGARGVRGRAVGGVSLVKDRDTDQCERVPLAGNGDTLVFSDNSTIDPQGANGVYRVVGVNAQLLAASGRALATVGGVVVIARSDAVEARNATTGATLWAFTSNWERAVPLSVAFNGTDVAVLLAEEQVDTGALIGKRLEVWRPTGILVRRFAVQKTTAPAFGFFRRALVYRVGNEIRVLNIDDGKSAILIRGIGRVVGLSVKQGRVVWGEQRTGRDVIRALRLPR
jgi:hypothetical protein